MNTQVSRILMVIAGAAAVFGLAVIAITAMIPRQQLATPSTADDSTATSESPLATLPASAEPTKAVVSTDTPALIEMPPPTETPTPAEPSPTPSLDEWAETLASLEPISAQNANHLVEVGSFGKGRASAVAWSADGQWLAVVAEPGVSLYDASAFDPVQFWEVEASAIAFSPDGTLLAASTETDIRLWDVPSGQLRRLLGDHTTNVNGLAFSPDGTLLIVASSASSPGAVTLWNVAGGDLARKLEIGNYGGVALSSDGAMLVRPSGFGGVTLWDMAGAKEVRSFEAETDVMSAAISPNGAWVAGWGDLKPNRGETEYLTVVVWNADSGEVVLREDETPWVDSSMTGQVVFSQDSTLLASANNRAVALWDLASRRKVRELPIGDGYRNWARGYSGPNKIGLAFSPDGKRLAIASGSVSVWNVADGKEESVSSLRREYSGEVREIVFSREGRWMAAASYQTLRLWDWANRDMRFVWPVAPRAEIWHSAVAFSPDGEQLAANDGGVVVLKTTNGQRLYSFEKWFEVGNIVFLPDGRLAAARWQDLYYGLPLSYHSGVTSWIEWKVAGGEEVKTMSKGTPVGELESHPDWRAFTSLAFSPDGLWLAVGENGGIVLWNVADGNERKLVRAQAAEVSRIVFSPDGSLLAAERNYTFITVTDVASGVQVHKWFTGLDRNATWSMGFSPDGSLLVAVCVGGVKVWDVVSGQEVLALNEPGVYSGMGFSPDGTIVALGRYDGTIRLWGVPKP